MLQPFGQQTQSIAGRPEELYLTAITPTEDKNGKRKLTAVCSHQTRIGNLDAHLI